MKVDHVQMYFSQKYTYRLPCVKGLSSLNVEYKGLNTYIEINCILKWIENIIISNCDIILYITGHSKSEQPNITQIVGQLNNWTK